MLHLYQCFPLKEGKTLQILISAEATPLNNYPLSHVNPGTKPLPNPSLTIFPLLHKSRIHVCRNCLAPVSTEGKYISHSPVTVYMNLSAYVNVQFKYVYNTICETHLCMYAAQITLQYLYIHSPTTLFGAPC